MYPGLVGIGRAHGNVVANAAAAAPAVAGTAQVGVIAGVLIPVRTGQPAGIAPGHVPVLGNGHDVVDGHVGHCRLVCRAPDPRTHPGTGIRSRMAGDISVLGLGGGGVPGRGVVALSNAIEDEPFEVVRPLVVDRANGRNDLRDGGSGVAVGLERVVGVVQRHIARVIAADLFHREIQHQFDALSVCIA